MTGNPDAVLLIDIENIIGQKAKPTLMAARVGALIHHAGPGVRAVAACARGRITEPSTHVLHEHNIRLLTVGTTKDAADEALLAEAKALAHQGYRRFVVASNDSTFAQLADLGSLEIVVWKTQKTRPVYAARASRIYRLQCPPAATATGPAPIGVPQREPSPSPAALLPPVALRRTPSDPVPPRPSVHRSTSGASLRASTPLCLVVTGLSLLTAGVIFGVGAVIGDLAAHRAVRRRATLRRQAGTVPTTTAYER